MVEQLLSSFSLVAVYLTLESSHRTLGYLRVRLLHGGLSSRPVRGIPPSPFFPIAPGAPSRYFRRRGWEARKVGPHVDEVKYILSSPSPVLRLYGGGMLRRDIADFDLISQREESERGIRVICFRTHVS